MTEYLRASFISSSSGTERQATNINKIGSHQFRKKFNKDNVKKNSNNHQQQSKPILNDYSIVSDEDHLKQKYKQSTQDKDDARSQSYQIIPQTLMIDIRNDNGLQQNKEKQSSKSKSPKQQKQQKELLSLQFDLKYRIIRIQVMIDDTSFSLTQKLLNQLNIQTTSQIILKISDIIQATLENYMNNLFRWINYQRLGKIDSALWKAQVYKNNQFLQDIENEMQIDLMTENLLQDKDIIIGKINVYENSKIVGEINILKNIDPEECVQNFFYATGLYYDQKKFNRLVNEVIQIQAIKGEISNISEDQLITNIKVSHDKLVKVNVRRNENMDKYMLKLSVNNKLTPKQSKFVKESILKNFYL